MNSVSEMCEKLLNERGVKLDQDHPDFDLHQVCAEVIHFMKISGWMASYGESMILLTQLSNQCDRTSTDANNAGIGGPFPRSFPHRFLYGQTPYGPLSVLSKSWLFTGICCRLGLDAFPTRLPSKETVCCVRLPNIGRGPIVVNFGQGACLISGGAPDKGKGGDATLPTVGEAVQYFSPLHPRDFLLEFKGNLVGDVCSWYLNDANAAVVGHNINAEKRLRALHAMGCLFSATPNPENEGQGGGFSFFIDPMAEALPLDGEAVVLNALFSGSDAETPPEVSIPATALHDTLRRAEDRDTSVMRRVLPSRKASGHFVGQIVQQSLTNHYGCIIGWKVSLSLHPDRPNP